MQQTAVLPDVISYMPSSVLARGASGCRGAWVAPYVPPSALVRRAISACEKGHQASKAASKAAAAFGMAPAFVKAGAAASSKVAAEHGVAAKTPEEAAAAADDARTAAEAAVAAGMPAGDAEKGRRGSGCRQGS